MRGLFKPGKYGVSAFSADGTDYYMSGSDDAQTEEIYQIIQNRE